jgi:tetraacyldisaccharide 4'-kinase
MNTFVRLLLFPVWFVYGFIIFMRNWMYDLKIFKSTEFHLPVISFGNITVGGTGKTPHAEYLIRLLKDNYKVAVLSRGYKRKTRNFIVATEQSTAEAIGDEPAQIKRKFPDLTVAVDRNRVNGIKKLNENIPDLDIILLDDAFQHRAVVPGVNILLVNYNRPLDGDSLMPLGRLREPAYQKKRADIIIVTKVPANITPMEKRLLEHQINPQSHQHLYFSTIRYGEPRPVFAQETADVDADFMSNDLSVLLVCGVAEPQSLIEQVGEGYKEVIPLIFPDHHNYTQHNISDILKKFNAISNPNKVIFTTEKDAARLVHLNLSEHLPEKWFYLPIEIEFLGNEGELFNRQILHYVKNNSRNSILYKK